MRTQTVDRPAIRTRSLELGAWIDRHARRLLAILVIGWCVVFGVAAVRKFQQYQMGFDLALIQQIIWNTVHGRPFETLAYDHTDNILGTDSFLIHLIFVPFYIVFPNPATLLVVQAIIVGTSAIAVYLLARQYLAQRWAALAFAAVYLAYQPVMYGTLYEVRERVLAMAFFLWILVCIHRRRFGLMLIPLALALACRLDTTIGVAMLGVYALLRRWPGATERASDTAHGWTAPLPWRYGLTLIGSAVVWYLFVTQVMVPSLTTRPGFMFVEHYSQFGSTPGEILTTIVTQPLNTLAIMLEPGKLWYLLGMFLPLLFLPLLNWRLLLIMLPLYGLNLLSPRKIQWDVYHHYQGLIVPLMLLATIVVTAALARRNLLGRYTVGWCVLAVLIGTAISQIAFDNPLPAILDDWQPTTRQITANDLLEEIPADVPVATGNLLAPHLDPRRGIFLVPGGDFYYVADPFGKAEYAVLDLKNAQERSASQQAIERGGWCIVDEQAEYRLMRRQAGARGERCAP